MTVLEIADAVRKADFNFPVLPEAYLRLVSVLDNTSSTISQIEHALSNPSLLVRILQIANSASFGNTGVLSLSAAIQRLGLKFVKNIALCVAMKSLFSCRDPLLHAKLENIWSHSALTASVCSVLASRLCLNPSIALTCGLLHSVGDLVVASYYDQHRLDYATFEGVAAECSSDLGVSYLILCNFPSEILEAAGSSTVSPYGKLVSASHYAEDFRCERLDSIGLTSEEFRRVFNSDERLAVYSALV